MWGLEDIVQLIISWFLPEIKFTERERREVEQI